MQPNQSDFQANRRIAMPFESQIKIMFAWRSLIAVSVVVSLAAAPARAEFGQELFKLNSSDAAVGDQFGRGVDISGNVAIIGACCKNDVAQYSGAAYLFDVTTGQQLHKLTFSDAGPSDFLGGEVGISGNIAIVGGLSSDKAYLFDVTTGQQIWQLTASDAGAPSAQQFGVDVVVSGNVAIVGTENSVGAAYLFDVTTGEELFKLTPSDAADGDVFGASVAISDRLAIVGARKAARQPRGQGAAYVFDVTTGQQLVTLTATDGRAGDWFGHRVAIDDRFALVTALTSDVFSTEKNRAVYAFDVTTGRELWKLESPSSMVTAFGFSVAVSGNTAIVGAPDRFGESFSSGSAYVFDILTGELLKQIFPSDAHLYQEFGHHVAIDGNLALMADRYGDKGTLKDTGSAYVFDVSRGRALPDYVVWRNGLGTTYTQDDYNTWRGNFGRSAAGAAAGTVGDAILRNVPEPQPLGLLLLALTTHVRRRRDGRMPRRGRQASRTLPAQRSAALAWRLLADLPG
jgi:outer membrane protein assembly factor BamB